MMLFVALAIAVSGAAAQGVDMRPYNVTAEGMYATQDKHNVGFITLTQFIDVNVLDWDFNHDKVIERHEYVCSLAAQDPRLASVAHALYDEYDSNHNHRLELNDFELFFKKMDTNGDGHVTKEEFINYYAKLLLKTEQYSLHGHVHPLHYEHYCQDHGFHGHPH